MFLREWSELQVSTSLKRFQLQKRVPEGKKGLFPLSKRESIIQFLSAAGGEKERKVITRGTLPGSHF
jgi:hypothetical protein